MSSMTASARRRQAEFDRQNLEAARIIAADPARYPGLLQEWARAVLRRLETVDTGGNHAQAATETGSKTNTLAPVKDFSIAPPAGRSIAQPRQRQAQKCVAFDTPAWYSDHNQAETGG